MEGLQNWFSPLLWIIGTTTALIAFIRLCKPVWAFVKLPKELLARTEENDKKDQERFDSLNQRLDRQQVQLNKTIEDLQELGKDLKKIDQIQLSLLHDRISEIYHNAIQQTFISNTDYHRACELYAENGESQYITTLMAELAAIHEQTIKEKRSEE